MSETVINKHSHTQSSVFTSKALKWWQNTHTHERKNKCVFTCARECVLTQAHTHTHTPLSAPNPSKGESVSKLDWQSLHCSSLSTAGQRKTWRTGKCIHPVHNNWRESDLIIGAFFISSNTQSDGVKLQQWKCIQILTSSSDNNWTLLLL